jgi:hypothetical protein
MAECPNNIKTIHKDIRLKVKYSVDNGNVTYKMTCFFLGARFLNKDRAFFSYVGILLKYNRSNGDYVCIEIEITTRWHYDDGVSPGPGRGGKRR